MSSSRTSRRPPIDPSPRSAARPGCCWWRRSRSCSRYRSRDAPRRGGRVRGEPDGRAWGRGKGAVWGGVGGERAQPCWKRARVVVTTARGPGLDGDGLGEVARRGLSAHAEGGQGASGALPLRVQKAGEGLVVALLRGPNVSRNRLVPGRFRGHCALAQRAFASTSYRRRRGSSARSTRAVATRSTRSPCSAT